MPLTLPPQDNQTNPLLEKIRQQALQLGFSDLTVLDYRPSHQSKVRFNEWLKKGYSGDMDFLARHAHIRFNPDGLLEDVQQILMVRMPYLSATKNQSADDWRSLAWQEISQPDQAVISLYAKGRDYHKIIRGQLQKLATFIEQNLIDEGSLAPFKYRVVCDSAPVMEVELARHMPDTWRGKHTLLIQKNEGSMFFLGGILCNLNLPLALASEDSHCGTCHRCIDICPTKAIIAPYELDARRCISYLTIEHKGVIPEEFRPLMGNRIYGCDDCQLICPWNKFAKMASHPDFKSRPMLDGPNLLTLYNWSEEEFLLHTAGSSIRRIGFWRWQRNITIAIGNALRTINNKNSLLDFDPDPLLCLLRVKKQEWQSDFDMIEHIDWALAQSTATEANE